RRRTLSASARTSRRQNKHGRFLVATGLGWGGGATSPGAAAVAAATSEIRSADTVATAPAASSSGPSSTANTFSPQQTGNGLHGFFAASTAAAAAASTAAAAAPSDRRKSRGWAPHGSRHHHRHHQKQRRDEKGMTGEMAGSPGGGSSNSRWRSVSRVRESLLVDARGARISPTAVASLDEAELEVSAAGGLRSVAADLVDFDRLDVTVEDIAGMEEVKRSLQEIISEPLDLPSDLYPARLIKPCTGILIYGPPGCGKTLLARAVAKQSGAAFISVKASTLMRRPTRSTSSQERGWTSVSDNDQGANRRARARGMVDGTGLSRATMVRAVFSLARKVQPCIVFFDEADGLCFKRQEGDGAAIREVMTELMQLLDEISCSRQDRVVVLAATNRPWDLDPAVQVRVRSFRL
ncbi:unnamed protein product, partial [Hapterophycus canaliculatus]